MEKNLKLGGIKAGLIKFGSFENMKAFYEKGEMYFNSFQFFKQLETKGDGRADRNEYCSVHYSGDYLKKYIKLEIKDSETGESLGVLNAENGLQDITLDYGNDKNFSHLYSLSFIDVAWAVQNDLIIDTKNFAPTKEYAVLIHDMNEFIDRFINKIHDIKKNCSMKTVEYVDKNSYYGEMGPFRKFNEYSYQNEFRIAVNFNTLEPQKIYLGSLKDIAHAPIERQEFYESECQITYNDKMYGLKTIKITNKSFFDKNQ